MSNATIHTERLLLEPWKATHSATLLALSSDPRVMRHIGLGQPWAATFAEEVSDKQREHWAKHGFGWRADIERASWKTVGFSALNFLGDGTVGLKPDEYEIGWWLAPSVWGRGFATEGARAIISEAFHRLNAPSVVARIQPSNSASVKIATFLGLTQELSTKGAHGESLDVYRLTASDYEADGRWA
jgi:RimJ/RimL family protein N-acetyltransferase